MVHERRAMTASAKRSKAEGMLHSSLITSSLSERIEIAARRTSHARKIGKARRRHEGRKDLDSCGDGAANDRMNASFFVSPSPSQRSFLHCQTRVPARLAGRSTEECRSGSEPGWLASPG